MKLLTPEIQFTINNFQGYLRWKYSYKKPVRLSPAQPSLARLRTYQKTQVTTCGGPAWLSRIWVRITASIFSRSQLRGA